MDFEPEYAPLNLGDTRDDDAQILDEMLQENPNPGLPYPSEPGQPKYAQPVPPTRLMTGSVDLAPDSPPQKLFNSDPNRCELILNFDSDTLAFVRIASDVANLAGNSVSAVFDASRGTPIRLEKHTGELWAQNLDDTETVMVSWIAVTR